MTKIDNVCIFIEISIDIEIFFSLVLRETWLSDCQRPLCIVKFAIGTREVDVGKIKDIRKNDILPLAELKDSYHALTGIFNIKHLAKKNNSDCVHFKNL